MKAKLKISIVFDDGVEISSDENPDLLHLTKGALNLLLAGLNNEPGHSHRWTEENVKQLEKYGFIWDVSYTKDTYRYLLSKDKFRLKRVDKAA